MIITKRTTTEIIVRIDEKTISIDKKEKIENVGTIIDILESLCSDKSNPKTTD